MGQDVSFVAKAGAITVKKKSNPALAKKMNKYRVYISQVNQTYVEVSAKNEEDAREKGYRKWRKEYAHSNVMSVEEIDDPKGEYGCQPEFHQRKACMRRLQ